VVLLSLWQRATEYEGQITMPTLKKKLKLSDKAYELLKKDIIDCVYQPGDMIVEATVCGRYKIGHTPFREATARLNAEGWIEIVPHRGYFAAPISPTHLRDIFEVRMMIEPSAAYIACTRATAEELALLKENVKESIKLAEANNVSASLRNSIEFHRLIASFTNNTELADLVGTLHFKLIRATLYILKVSSNSHPLNFHHKGILKAFIDRDPTNAQKEMEKDLQDARNSLEAFMSSTRAA
jgi:DNA-binding GntR family transcriptional regulator